MTMQHRPDPGCRPRDADPTPTGRRAPAGAPALGPLSRAPRRRRRDAATGDPSALGRARASPSRSLVARVLGRGDHRPRRRPVHHGRTLVVAGRGMAGRWPSALRVRRRGDSRRRRGAGRGRPSRSRSLRSLLGQLGLWLFARNEGGVLPLDRLPRRDVRAARARSSSLRRGRWRAVAGARDERRAQRSGARPRPTTAQLVDAVDEWWGGREIATAAAAPVVPALQRDVVDRRGRRTGRLVGFLVGFISPDRPGRGVHPHDRRPSPNHRRRGLGRALYERFFDDARGRAGARRVHAVTWPGNRMSVAFHRAMGFQPDDGPGHAATLRRRRPTPTTTPTARTGSVVQPGDCDRPPASAARGAGARTGPRGPPRAPPRASAAAAPRPRRRRRRRSATAGAR